MSFLTESSLPGGFIRGPWHHVRKLITSRNYRQVAWLKFRYGLARRFTPHTIYAFGVRYEVPDVASFLSMLDEIYGKEIYRFECDHADPVIVDIGANIGVSVNYFLAVYPASRIYAYEADPEIFDHLVHNVDSSNPAVTLVNKAVWDENTTMEFSQQGADGGRLGGSGGIDVPAIDIKGILNGRMIDLLKIDIEGAEQRVIPACAGLLGGVRRIFLEYHSARGEPQRLGEILDLLNREGFRLHVQPVFTSRQPFSCLDLHGEFDMQLNIFGWRETA